MSVSNKELFKKSTIETAKALLGMKLSTRVNGKVVSGMIVEVEAYHQDRDKAAHTYGGKITGRNRIMFQRPGLCYVYFIYGMYYCVNVVTEDEGIGAAVLIRGLIPLEGIKTMARRRSLSISSPLLTNGPGKLCEALAIDKKLSGEDLLTSKRIWLEPYRRFRASQIKKSKRIGISKSKHLQWRFFVEDEGIP